MDRSARHLLRPVVIGLAALALATSLAGCKAPKSKRVAIEGSAVVAGGFVGLDVKNHNGGVRVVVEPWRDEGIVVARTRSGKRVPTENENGAAWVAAESIEEDGRTVLRVLAMPNDDANAEPVDLVIIVPECRGLTVRNAGGPVEITGVSGAIEVESGIHGGSGGWIHLRTDHHLTGPVRLSTNDGSITCVVTPHSSGNLDLRADNGKVRVFAPSGYFSGVTATQSTLSGVFNHGGNDFVLRSGRGDVRLVLRERPQNYTIAHRD